MIEIKTEITIEASIAQVWAKLTDFNAYPTWNPFISHISGELIPEGKLHVTVTPPGMPPSTFQPILLQIQEHKELCWVGKIFSEHLFRGEHYFRLEPMGNNKTRFIHGEIFSGILSAPLIYFIKKKTEEGFHQMNQALSESEFTEF